MGRSPCCTNNNLNKGAWTKEEDEILGNYVKIHGAAKWNILCKKAGLNRCGKSCRLRWTNYLRPDIKRGNFSEEEDSLIINLHSSLGNKWSKIASQLPGRTDNEIKNHWNTKIRKKLNKLGIDPQTHKQITNLNLFNSLQVPPLFSQQDVTQLAKLQLLHFQTLLQTINAITTTFPSNPLMPNINYPMQDDVNGILNFSMPNFEVPGHYNFNSIPDSETCFQSGLISSEVLNVNSINPETSTPNQGSLNYLNSSTMSSSTLMFETWKELVNDETNCPFFSNCNLE